MLAGPFATRVLADLGADVIKVQTERRAAVPYANDFPYNVMWNRSKRSITLNMTDERALTVLQRLVEQADVVIENFSAGVLDQWGAGGRSCRRGTPGGRTCRCTAPASTGRGVTTSRSPPTVHALSGLTALTGPDGRSDCGPGVSINDFVSGLAAAVAVLAALEARRAPAGASTSTCPSWRSPAISSARRCSTGDANRREALAAGTRDAFTRPRAQRRRARCATGAGWR